MNSANFALRKELLQTRAAAERLELRALTGRLQPGAARGARLQRIVRLATAARRNPLFAAATGALAARLPLGRFWRFGAKIAAMGWAGWQLYQVIRDFQRK